jgi:hypothetical protein
MFEPMILAIIRQASLLTKPQQDEFTSKVAEALSTLINSTSTEIDDEVMRAIALPLGISIVEKIQKLI